MTYKVWARSLPTGFLPTSFCKLRVVPTIVLVRLDIPSMVRMPSLWRLAWLGLVPIVVMAAGITVNGLTCPDSDKRGNSWTNTVFNVRDNTIKECDYSGGALCAYFANGIVNPANSTDEDNVCPDELLGVPSNSATSAATAQSPPTNSASKSSSAGHTSQSQPLSSFDPSSASRSASSTAPTRSQTSETGSGTVRSPNTSSDLTPSSSSTSTSPQANRAKIRTAAIAGSVVSFGFVVGVVLFVLWIRRRRQRLGQNTHPEQYVGDPMTERSPGRRPKLHIAPFGIALVSARRDQRRVEAAAESDVVPIDRREDGTSRDEALTERLRRIEVQLQTLLDMELPEGAPPSYRS
ncbi:hypothetical protein B0H14DRAFT_2722361 [Mycena olivaceomarginata]|nr:hypothetical protein B0H14DRAFT_2722361 [Mycena olivaceomarginata]